MNLTRRDAIATSLGALLSGAVGREPYVPTAGGVDASRLPAPGRLKQSLARWCYGSIPLPELCKAAKRIGLAGIDLLARDEWDVVRDAGLVCSMGYPYPKERDGFIATGFNDPANHALLLGELEEAIPLAARHGVPNVITMFGNRKGRSDEEGIANCITGLKRIAPVAEEHQVTVCVELLNSKVDHHDYQGDHTSFGTAVIDGVGSSRVKLLYDIYHMQIMEGDVIRTIRGNVQRIAHFHTGGVPGRHELDDTQELDYRGIARAIADTGFTGFVAHEFEPARDPLTSLAEAAATCTV
ncbi:MAG TPA: TIM barrel protein [Gemmatimonadales bacterium]|nr:TIM barrel protein [Gemmatimonadales bacterium]